MIDNRTAQRLRQEAWKRLSHEWRGDPEACFVFGFQAGLGAVAPRVEPPVTESGGGFESHPASVKEPLPEALLLADLLKTQGLDPATTVRMDSAAELRRLHAENEALRVSLKKANAQAEHFEREWYLRGDENESLRADAERFRFANDSEEDFAICYWDERMGNGGEWMCNGSKGNAIDLLDAAIVKAT